VVVLGKSCEARGLCAVAVVACHEQHLMCPCQEGRS
jgi:hypothetical protein